MPRRFSFTYQSYHKRIQLTGRRQLLVEIRRKERGGIGDEAATRASINDPVLQERMGPLGLEPAPKTTAELGKFIADAIDKWGKVIKFADIKVN